MPAAVATSVATLVPTGDAGGLHGRMTDHLRRALAPVIGLAVDRLDVATPLEEYGFDSVMAVELTGALEKTFGELPKVLFFEHQTIAAAVGYFLKEHSDRVRELFASSAASGLAPVEAKAVASLRHANIVQVYDVGDSNGRPYFTVELVEGASLAEKVAGAVLPRVAASGGHAAGRAGLGRAGDATRTAGSSTGSAARPSV